MALNENDVRHIAEAVVKVLDEGRAGESLHMDARQHYDEHAELRDFLASFKEAKSIVWKTVLSAAMVGLFILAALGVGKKW